MSAAIPALFLLVVSAQPYDLAPLYLQTEALEQAYRAYAAAEWSEAEELLERSIAESPEADTNAYSHLLLTEVIRQRIRRERRRARKRALREQLRDRLQQLPDLPTLKDYTEYRLGEVLKALGDTQEAREHYDNVRGHGSYGLNARTASAQLALAADDPNRALELLAEAQQLGTSQQQADQIQLLRAECLAASGDRSEAIQLLEDLWRERYGRHASRKAAQQLQALGQRPKNADIVVMEFQPTRGKSARQLRRRLRRLRRSHRRAGAAAFRYARGVIALEGTENMRSAVRYFRGAIRSSNRFVKGYALMGLARTREKMDRDREARINYGRLYNDLPNHPLAAEAMARDARLLRAEGDQAGANALLQKLNSQYPDAPDRTKFRWISSWEHFRAGAYEAALSGFKRIAQEDGQRIHIGRIRWGERAHYWVGRCYEALGNQAEATHVWTEIIQNNPLSYYSNLAYNKLHAVDPERAAELRPLPRLDPSDHDHLIDLSQLVIQPTPELQLAVALTKAGLYVAARKDLEVRARAGRLNPDGQTLLASLTLRTQPPSLPDSIIRWRGRLPDYPNPHNQRLWKYAYPLPYWDLIERFSAEWGLDPFLALALIRHESRYNANAVSPARAVGLMQILPTTAGSVARRLLNEPRPSARALKQPERNIRLGTRLVQELMSLFSNNEALVLAAYNAGSGRTRGWLRRANEQGISDVDVFVEEIPFRQTHGYVKAVLATYGVYRYLYGSRERPAHRSIPLETVLPESLGPYFRR